MNITPETKLPDVIHIFPTVYKDIRGSLYESYSRSSLHRFVSFHQTNIVHTNQSALRGMHYQHRFPQGKLLTVIDGEIFDVVMDVRSESATFGVAAGFYLTPGHQVYVPAGYAHGFVSISEKPSIVMYQMTHEYKQEFQRSILWSTIPGITWPISYPILSDKDRSAASWQEILPQLTK